jgi:predicted phage terminase large subunit-like protein
MATRAPISLPPVAELAAEQARRHLAAFARRMFPGYEQPPHLAQLIGALEAAATTPGARLIVIMPPRFGKSLTASELFPAWVLGRFPDRRIIAASHTGSLAFTFSRRARNLLDHPRWPWPGVTTAGDRAAVAAWDIADHRGGYVAAGVGGSITGHGADLLLVDDPVKDAASADSATIRESVWEWFTETARTRLEPGGGIVVIGTRWHAADLIGRLLAAPVGDQWTVLHFPAITATGDPLWPERWPLADLLATRATIGSRAWQALYLGVPQPAEGGLFRRSWWRFWHPPERPVPPVIVRGAGGEVLTCPVVPLPSSFDEQLQSWDLSFKRTEDGSFVVGQVWGRVRAEAYLLDQYRARTDFVGTLIAIRALAARWPFAAAKLVEDAANGPAVISALAGEIPGIIAVPPSGSKESRAAAVTPFVESGSVLLPHPVIAPWVQALIDEAAAFPTGAHDDQVDALSQALARLLGSGAAGGVTSERYVYWANEQDPRDDPWAD